MYLGDPDPDMCPDCTDFRRCDECNGANDAKRRDARERAENQAWIDFWTKPLEELKDVDNHS